MKTNEESVFTEALAKGNPRERASFLDQACAGDPALRESVESLLTAYEAGGFLETPVVERPGSEVKDQAPGSSTQAYSSIDTNESASLEFLTPSAKPDVLGRLGHYEILEVIGRGGMGIVLRAFDEKLHRVVAIKVMAEQLATNATARRRFTREAQAQAAVSHDHIATIHAVEEANGLPYLVMQHVAGLSLQQRLDKNGPLHLLEILRIGMQTASGLAAAHAQGLVHRDIKPANILLENGVERVKVADFGLARAATEANLTQSGAVAGTPQYMSPEQAEGKAIDQRTDLFSLGSVMYAMCTGRAPFRASGTMAVLKRVCEETPTPIRQTNSEIPDWLVAIIDKLHAKDPAQRFQSAAEVAELLARHLAQVQHPSLSPLSPVAEITRLPSRTELWRVPLHRRRLALAAAILLCFVAGLSLTEATGVTHLRATLVRIFTPEGTPVVETDDPDVKVEKGAFVLLAAEKERKFDTLAEAVQGASDGDTIEVRGNGPFVTKPIMINQRALTIRAGAGFSPVISADPEEQGDGPQREELALMRSPGLLVLEGLDLRWFNAKPGGIGRCLVVSYGPAARLHAINCRFLMNRREGPHNMRCVGPVGSPLCHLRNCQLLVCGHGTGFRPFHIPPGGPNSSVVVENCVVAFGVVIDLTNVVPNKIVLDHNTFFGGHFLKFYTNSDLTERKQGSPALEVLASANIFDGQMEFHQHPEPPESVAKFTGEEVGRTMKRLLGWRDHGNLYSSPDASKLLTLNLKTKPNEWLELRLPAPVTTLAAWKDFWGIEKLDSLRGLAKFQGGDLASRATLTPELLTPEDFRLRPDSPGYKAGKDKKDLGADVDLVGPGETYERWKKMPEYQQWLKETGQFRAETPKPEPGAFVVLGAKGVEVRKFDTLAEAVQGTSDGDTIEVRGNGPFVCDPIKITQALTIRAGAGFRPVINLTAVPEPLHQAGLNTVAPLVLEGLEFRVRDPHKSKVYHSVVTATKALRVANCRFSTDFWCLHSSPSSPLSVWEVRNCEFLGSKHYSRAVSRGFASGQKVILENCVSTLACLVSGGAVEPKEPSLQLTRNTFRTYACVVELVDYTDRTHDLDDAKKGNNVLLVEASGNLLDSYRVLVFSQRPPGKILSPTDAKKYLAQVACWKGERNLYSIAAQFLDLWSIEKGHYDLANPIKKLADWKQFWTTAEDNSIEGVVRYQGGDLLAKVELSPEKVTPEDFRLHPDSAGYKAGKDSKDLGADVDLVGPGEAYERWKKTPEYQQWLKDTKQVTKAEAPKAEPKAFVVLGGKGVAERNFDTLAEAARGASDGDIIEVRGNGPFDTPRISITGQALTIRAGQGHRPVIRLTQEALNDGASMFVIDAPLVLEGLELQFVGQDNRERPERGPVAVESDGAPLSMANCTLLHKQNKVNGGLFRLLQSRRCELRNCLLLAANGGLLNWGLPGGKGELIIENCLRGGSGSINFYTFHHNPQDFSIQIRRTTTVMQERFFYFNLDRPVGLSARPIRVEVSDNVLETGPLFTLNQRPGPYLPAQPLAAAEAQALVPRLLDWHGKRNVYSVRRGYVALSVGKYGNELLPPATPIETLKDWARFLNTEETDSLEGQARYQGGALRSSTRTAVEQLIPDDFRLRPDSPGYKAGKDGKDLGADVDLVGPGTAYERWKKTPEYQQWLKDTKQVTKTEATKAEPKAFVVLHGKGIEVRNFDTLAEAARGASDGDIIEVRGNGPFVSQPVVIKDRALTIRAGEGFRPVIKGDPEAQAKDLLSTNAPLVLEGLDFQWVEIKAFHPTDPNYFRLVVSSGPRSRLQVANCRFLMNRREGPYDGMNFITTSDSATCRLRNCQFFVGGRGRRGGSFLAYRGILNSELVVDNCLIVGHGVGLQLTHAEPMKAFLSRNTVLGSSSSIVHFRFGKKIDPPGDDDSRPLQIVTSANILDGFVQFTQSAYLSKEKAFSATEAEQFLMHLVGWRENRNLYLLPDKADLFRLSAETTPVQITRLSPTVPTKTLADWKRFWGMAELDSLRGQGRFQGGDLVTKAGLTPELLIAEDFRLSPDSAGYRAGKDGKDLGADVDLVGPGPAYERWKKTPEYQQWLKDTKQAHGP